MRRKRSLPRRRDQAAPERAWVRKAPRSSYSTYPPSFQSELLYTDSEKRPDQSRHYRLPSLPPARGGRSLLCVQDPSRAPRPRWGLFSHAAPTTSIVAARRVRRPRDVLQDLPRHARQLGDVSPRSGMRRRASAWQLRAGQPHFREIYIRKRPARWRRAQGCAGALSWLSTSAQRRLSCIPSGRHCAQCARRLWAPVLRLPP